MVLIRVYNTERNYEKRDEDKKIPFASPSRAEI